MTTDSRKITNVSGEDLIVPWLGGRLVLAGETVVVDAEDVPAYLCQPSLWEAGTEATREVYAAVIAEAEQVAAQAAAEEAERVPFDPGPIPLGLTAEEAAERAAAAAGEHVEQGAPDVVATPEVAPTPTRTADPVPQPTPAANPAQAADVPVPGPPAPLEPTAAERFLDRTNAPAEESISGILNLRPQPRL